MASAIDRSMYWPSPCSQRRCSAALIRKTCIIPTTGSVQMPPIAGSRPGKPCKALHPVKHWIKVPYATWSVSGPKCPSPALEIMIMSGLANLSSSYPNPSLSMTPGAKFSITTSLMRARSLANCKPLGWARFRVTLFLPWLMKWLMVRSR